MNTKSICLISIDDSRAVHAFIDRSLENTKYFVKHAMNAKEGLEILKTHSNEISLVLLDWEMPELSGPEVLPQIKKMYPNLPVVMLTSKNEPEDISSMIQSGASEYIMKPFTPDILVEKIESVLEA